MEKVIIGCLLQGMNQKEISERLSELDMGPCSLSAIEKIIKKLKLHYKAKKMFHLGAKIAENKKHVTIISQPGISIGLA